MPENNSEKQYARRIADLTGQPYQASLTALRLLRDAAGEGYLDDVAEIVIESTRSGLRRPRATALLELGDPCANLLTQMLEHFACVEVEVRETSLLVTFDFDGVPLLYELLLPSPFELDTPAEFDGDVRAMRVHPNEFLGVVECSYDGPVTVHGQPRVPTRVPPFEPMWLLGTFGTGKRPKTVTTGGIEWAKFKFTELGLDVTAGHQAENCPDEEACFQEYGSRLHGRVSRDSLDEFAIPNVLARACAEIYSVFHYANPGEGLCGTMFTADGDTWFGLDVESGHTELDRIWMCLVPPRPVAEPSARRDDPRSHWPVGPPR